jgi:predicted metal-dependent hydrolase
MRETLHGPGGLPVDVKRTRRKRTVGIAVEDRRVKIYAPKWVPLQEIQEIIQKRSPWIDRQVQLQAALPTVSPRMFVDGEHLPFLGRQYTLRVEVASNPSVNLDGDQIVVTLGPENNTLPFHGIDFLAERADEVRDQLMDWYQAQAEDILTEATDRYSLMLGVVPSAVTVRHYSSQWGSCSISGHIRLNRRIIFSGRQIAEYVVAHEVSHLEHHNHSQRFWNCVEDLDPDFREHRDWLHKHGSTLNI